MQSDSSGIQIAPGFTIADWRSLSERMDPSAYDENWETAISHLYNRLKKRFLEPADVLLRDEIEQINSGSLPKGLGFTVLAIDCLLIETICGYEQGLRTRHGGTNSAFTLFLTTAPRFKEVFAQEGLANYFASAVRNGLLHDGETRAGWIIWQGRPNGPILEDLGGGFLRLYRSAFHDALSQFVEAYFQRLRDPEHAQLRANMKSRLNQLCDDSEPAQRA